MVQGLGSRAWGVGFVPYCSGSTVLGLCLAVLGLGFMPQGVWLRVQGSRLSD